MANEEHVKILRQGVEAWNAWREKDPGVRPDLSEANLEWADFSKANLCGAVLRGAKLSGACLTFADLEGANCASAGFTRAELREAKLEGTNLKEAIIYETIFNNVDLSDAIHLSTCRHQGPSCVDHRTLALSKNVPINFWRGCGLPDRLIEYVPSIFEEAIQFYSCFISYSSKDQEFADRLHADLQDNGVRCWFAPQDLPIGKKILDGP